ncbi:MAG: hypothetical protein O3C05_02035 [Proteobacteria bacterium]|nr:hypothetical protein [Pseudomonadota bacterium]
MSDLNNVRQCVLPFVFKDTHLESDFVTSLCNIEAYRITECELPSDQVLIIGDRYSGKTHLGMLWAKKHNAKIIDCKDSAHNEFIYSVMRDINKSSQNYFLIENIHMCSDEKLFSMINAAKEAKVNVLMTTRKYGVWKIPDLLSRINAMYKVLIKDPDPSMIASLLSVFFAKKQIVIAQNVIDFIAMNIERSFFAIHTFVDVIDKLSIEKKRNIITVPFIKPIILNLSLGNKEAIYE